MKRTTFIVFLAFPSLLLAEDMIGLVIGGFGGGASVEVITKNGVCSDNTVSPRIPQPPSGSIFGWTSALQTINDKEEIVLCGGKILEESRLCHTLELGAQDWKTGHCTMSVERMYASMSVNSQGQIVMSAGYSSRNGWLKDLDMISSVDSNCGQDCCDWVESVTEIPGRGVYGHCSVIHNDDLYIIGGNSWDQEVGQYDIGDVWKYSFSQNKWTQLESLNEPRQSMGCIQTTHNGKSGIMVAGGFCHNNPDTGCYQDRIQSTVFYDFEQGTWEELEPLVTAREGLALFNIEGTIMAVGGGNYGTPINTIEEWTGDRWVLSDMKLSSPRRAFAHVQVPKSSYNC